MGTDTRNLFIEAISGGDSVTANGMVTNSTTMDKCLDFFFKVGGLRFENDESKIVSLFENAFSENPLTALKILFWARDIRGGAGERRVFRTILTHMSRNRLYYDAIIRNLELVPDYGRWDDLFSLFDSEDFRRDVILMFTNAIAEKMDAENTLGNNVNGAEELRKLYSKITKGANAAKWLPRKGKIAAEFQKYLGLTPKKYRRMVVDNTNVVETLMCANNWDKISYENVPSLAMARYAKAFGKHDEDRFSEYKNSDAKINSGAVYPYDVTKTLYHDADLAMKQWDSLPNYLTNNSERILPVCDVSGSMTTTVRNSQLSCLDICISLGLYISERNDGSYKDCFITFSQRPELVMLSGNLLQRYNQLRTSDWGYNTDVISVFRLILQNSVKMSVPKDQMPTVILILSDMEFDADDSNYGATAFDIIKNEYASSGYDMPKLVFWNLKSSNNRNYPVRKYDDNTALISGFSPSILKSVLSCEDMNPMSIMNATIGSKRYEGISI